MARKNIEQIVSDIHNFQINPSNNEIYLHSSYQCLEQGQEPGVEYRMATTFIKNLHILEQSGASDILVHMHTVGGDVPDGLAICDAIKFSECPVTILAYAQASSMSSVILQAADRRILTPECEVMVHHGDITVSGNCVAVKSTIDFSEKVRKRILVFFAKRAIYGKFFRDKKYNLKQVIEFLDNKISDTSDWVMDAEEAVYYGFADNILGEKGCESYTKVRSKKKWPST